MVVDIICIFIACLWTNHESRRDDVTAGKDDVAMATGSTCLESPD